MSWFLRSAGLAGVFLAIAVMANPAAACPVDATAPAENVDLKINARGDAFVQYMGSADTIVVMSATDSSPSTESSNDATLTAGQPSGVHPVSPALIPLPAGVWSGLVGLGALAARAALAKLRR